MEYKRANDIYSFECNGFKVLLCGHAEKIEFNRESINSRDTFINLVNDAHDELKRLKEIRSANDKSAGIASSMSIKVNIDADEVNKAIEMIKKETGFGEG